MMEPDSDPKNNPEKKAQTDFMRSLLFPGMKATEVSALIEVRQSDIPLAEREEKILSILNTSHFSLRNSDETVNWIAAAMVNPELFEYSVREIIQKGELMQNMKGIRDIFEKVAGETIFVLEHGRKNPDNVSRLVQTLESDWHIEALRIKPSELWRFARELVSPEHESKDTGVMVAEFLEHAERLPEARIDPMQIEPRKLAQMNSIRSLADSDSAYRQMKYLLSSIPHIQDQRYTYLRFNALVGQLISNENSTKSVLQILRDFK